MGKEERGESSQSRETRIPKIILPYIRNLSEAIRRILTPLDIRTAFRPMRTLTDILVHVKDPVPPEAKSGTVYCISCSGFPASYVGQTGRTVRDRVKERKYALRTGNGNASALAKHTIITGHLIDWDDVEVIDSHSDTFQHCVIEGWHIVCQHHPLNRDQSQLLQVYRQLACCCFCRTCSLVVCGLVKTCV